MSATHLDYRRRLELLVERKLQQNRDKLKYYGYMNEDDYGYVVPPADFKWHPAANHPSGSFFGAKGWGDNFRSLMEAHPVYVDPLDALAGRGMLFLSRYRRPRWKPEFDFSFLKEEQERYDIRSGIGADSHFGPDFALGLRLGWGGLLAKVRRFRAQYGPEKAEFFQAEEDVVLGVQNWITRTVAAIREMERTEAEPVLRANLREMAALNEWLLEGAPRTFREACQWIAWYGTVSRTYNRDGAGCQLDELLAPYYQRDCAAGVLDDEAATFYLACLLLNDTKYYQLGGTDPQGRDVTNRVSFLVLEAAHRLGIPCNLTVRVHAGQDREFFLASVRCLCTDRKGWPRYAGDAALVAGFMRNGYPAELARQRIAVGCHWMAIPGREYTLNDCVKINTAKVLEVALHEMFDDKAAPSMAELWARFESHLRRAVLCTARGIDFHLAHQADSAPELLLNLLCHGPIEKGVDVTQDGVEYFNMCVDGAGLATVADSFAALEQRVEREKALTWEEVAQHLRAGYAGPEGERARLLLRRSAHYGEGGSLGDDYAVRVSQLFTRLVTEKPTPGGRRMIPGWFTWSDTIPMGKKVGATPNGRRPGDPLSHGANPDPGFRRDGAPTAMAQAIAAIQPGYGNTAPMQLELNPGLLDQEAGIAAVAALIQTHFALGGTLFNVNVLDAEKLRAAHKEPERYPDLVVRVTGFTAYFVSLSPEFRQLVVDRVLTAQG